MLSPAPHLLHTNLHTKSRASTTTQLLIRCTQTSTLTHLQRPGCRTSRGRICFQENRPPQPPGSSSAAHKPPHSPIYSALVAEPHADGSAFSKINLHNHPAPHWLQTNLRTHPSTAPWLQSVTKTDLLSWKARASPRNTSALGSMTHLWVNMRHAIQFAAQSHILKRTAATRRGKPLHTPVDKHASRITISCTITHLEKNCRHTRV